MDDDRIDFSALDPSRDELKWERTVRAVTARALAARPPGVMDDVARWARPALALAAGVALLAWLPSLGAKPAQVTVTASARGDVVANLADWAVRGGEASDAWFESLEAGDGQR